MSNSSLAKALALAATQHGLLRQVQLAACGIDRHATSRLVRKGLLERVGGHGILRTPSVGPTWRQDLLCAVWTAGPGAAASHRSSGLLWEFDTIVGRPLEVSSNRTTGRRRAGYTLYRYSDLTPSVVTTVDGIPTTEPTRTLLDLASIVEDEDLEAAIESALRAGRSSLLRMRKVLERHARPGRPGVARFRRVLGRQEQLEGVTESMFETRLVQVLRSGGLPEPVRQIELWDEDGFIGRFDVTYPESLVAIEADSLAWHRSPARFEADRAKRARAEALGWRVPAYTWRQVTRTPAFVVRTVREMLALERHPTARSTGPPALPPRRRSA